MKIKSIYMKLAIIPIAGMITLASCTGFLDEISESKHVMDDFYKNTKELDAGVLGIYGQAKKIFQGGSLSITTVGTDELYARNTSGAQSIADRYLYPASNPSTTNWYKTHYEVIQSANIVINRAPNVPGITEPELNAALAEAKVIRAWCYFRLVQTLGSIPLVLTETKQFNYRIRRNPIEEVYGAIIEDLEFAAAEGVLSQDKTVGRINQWVAKGILAKVYLTLGTSMTRRPQPIEEYNELSYDPKVLFENCRTLCDDIIASGVYNLEHVYGDIFLINNRNGDESMWELQYGSSPKTGSNWSKNFGAAQINSSNAYTMNSVVGQGFYCPLPSFYRYFSLGDVRRTWSIADYRVEFDKNTLEPLKLAYVKDEVIGAGEYCNLDTDHPDSLAYILNSTTATRIRVSKYRWGTKNKPEEYWKETMAYSADNLPTNVIVLRYADILLMRIEADILINQGVAGQVSVDIMNNELVARARGWDITTGSYITQQDMEDRVMAIYHQKVDDAEALYQADPTNTEAYESLQAAIADLEAKKSRLLFDYTAQTLTYEELMRQRACELCFEFSRWFDLCRTGTLHTLVPARIVDPNLIPPVMFRFDINYLMPLPTYELDLAKDKTLFYQNPGY